MKTITASGPEDELRITCCCLLEHLSLLQMRKIPVLSLPLVKGDMEKSQETLQHSGKPYSCHLEGMDVIFKKGF